MAARQATWWVAVAFLTLGPSLGCSAEGASVEDQGVGNGSGSGGTGAQFGATGGVTILSGGTQSGALPAGKVRGRLRDFNAGFPDYRPRLDPTMGGPTGIVDQSQGSAYTKNQDNLDTDIVGPLLSPLGIDGKPIYFGDPVVGTITTWGSVHPLCEGQPCFNYWYRDDPRFNQAIDFELQLVEDPNEPGKWVFDNNGQMWFPIDNQLSGNDDPEYPEHNYGFTFEIRLDFRYIQGQVFTFVGDDDVFVYINSFLVINLGGIHDELVGSVELDGLGLTPDSDYSLYFFFAERNPTFSHFRIETTIAPEDWVIE